MYKVASDKHQRALHHGKPTDWVNGDEAMTPEQRLEQMKDGLKIMEARIRASAGVEKIALGQEMQKLQQEISVYRRTHGLLRKTAAAVTANAKLPSFFMDAAREILSPSQYEIIRNAAIRLQASGQRSSDRGARRVPGSLQKSSTDAE